MRRQPSLDGLRAVSIVFVLIGHLSEGQRGAAAIAHHLSFLGVRVFFVISGFLITAILAEELTRTHAVDFKRFYIKRAWRLMPAFYAYLLFVLILAIRGLLPLHTKDFLFAAAYIMNYYPGGGPWAVGHFWSLAVEEQFYFFWPLTFWWAGVRRAPAVLLFVLIAAPLTRFLLFPFRHSLGPVYGDMFPCVCDALAVGCLLALVRDRLQSRPGYMAMLRSGMYILLAPLALALELVMPEALSVVLGPSLVNVAIAILIDGCMTFPATWIGKLLNLRFVTVVGLMSYSIYLWQQPFLNHEQRAPWTSFPVNLLLAFALASVSYFLIEKPLIAYGRRSLSEKAPGSQSE